jgi:hypothetical protein
MTAPFHDREDFATHWSSKSFAIMGNPLPAVGAITAPHAEAAP